MKDPKIPLTSKPPTSSSLPTQSSSAIHHCCRSESAIIIIVVVTDDGSIPTQKLRHLGHKLGDLDRSFAIFTGDEGPPRCHCQPEATVDRAREPEEMHRPDGEKCNTDLRKKCK